MKVKYEDIELPGGVTADVEAEIEGENWNKGCPIVRYYKDGSGDPGEPAHWEGVKVIKLLSVKLRDQDGESIPNLAAGIYMMGEQGAVIDAVAERAIQDEDVMAVLAEARESAAEDWRDFQQDTTDWQDR